MEARLAFRNVIACVESSKLNYIIINKTPFSATISIKSSFIKRFDETSQIENETQDVTETLKKENLSLKLKLREVEKSFEELVNMEVKRHEAEEERNRLENVLAKEKVKIKECEQDAEAFRSEVLGLKSDKKKIGLTLASIEEEVKKLKIENKGLKKELDSNHIKVEKSENTCDKIVTKFPCKLCDKILSDQTEIQEHAKTHHKHKCNQTDEIQVECPFCGVEFPNRVDLSDHVRCNHVKDQVCQTQPANEPLQKINIESSYPCFYCGKIITSSNEMLKEHSKHCLIPIPKHCEMAIYKKPLIQSQYHPQSFMFPIDFPCYTCPKVLSNKQDLRMHYDTSHPEKIMFWCEVCLTNFGSDRGLKSHMRNQHQIYS